jgi:hypothetical protein
MANENGWYQLLTRMNDFAIREQIIETGWDVKRQ